ncbi:MAG: class I SAM-dependent methyltransferase [Bdellovibrionales bacterium]
MSQDTKINHVSDTALWVAHYRAIESERPDALFKDPFAKILVGERGKEIADSMKTTSDHTQWSVVIRTTIIDNYIQELVKSEGIDTVINLGAGMDTRPYRLELPKHLRWIEVDYAQIINHKTNLLAHVKPHYQLERIVQDLSDREARKKLFLRLAAGAKKVLVLTEGVLPYLSEEQVATLAADLKAEKKFAFWIAEYFSPGIYRYFKTVERSNKMKNSPFKFFPADWYAFFASNGWAKKEIRYFLPQSLKLGRKPPMPWWAYFIGRFLSEAKKQQYAEMAGYVLFVPKP